MTRLKALYISSYHPTLENDDLKMLTELGFDWFSTGIHLLESNSVNSIEHLRLRERLPRSKDHEELKAEFLVNNPLYYSQFRGLQYPEISLCKTFVDKFDLVIVLPIHSLEHNWDKIKHKPVVLKTCGNTYNQEMKIKKYFDQGLKIVRASETENLMKNANPATVIRQPFWIDSLPRWKDGNSKVVLSFISHFKQRRSTQPVKNYLEVVVPNFEYELYGAYAAGHKDPLVLGTLTRQQQLEKFCNCGCYFAIASGRAPLTYNIVEAMALGIPTITVGSKVGGQWSTERGFPNLYEPTSLFRNEIDCLMYDDPVKLKDMLTKVLEDSELRKVLSEKGSESVEKIFSNHVVCKSWRKFYKKEYGFQC